MMNNSYNAKKWAYTYNRIGRLICCIFLYILYTFSLGSNVHADYRTSVANVEYRFDGNTKLELLDVGAPVFVTSRILFEFSLFEAQMFKEQDPLIYYSQNEWEGVSVDTIVLRPTIFRWLSVGLRMYPFLTFIEKNSYYKNYNFIAPSIFFRYYPISYFRMKIKSSSPEYDPDDEDPEENFYTFAWPDFEVGLDLTINLPITSIGFSLGYFNTSFGDKTKKYGFKGLTQKGLFMSLNCGIISVYEIEDYIGGYLSRKERRDYSKYKRSRSAYIVNNSPSKLSKMIKRLHKLSWEEKRDIIRNSSDTLFLKELLTDKNTLPGEKGTADIRLRDIRLTSILKQYRRYSVDEIRDTAALHSIITMSEDLPLETEEKCKNRLKERRLELVGQCKDTTILQRILNQPDASNTLKKVAQNRLYEQRLTVFLRKNNASRIQGLTDTASVQFIAFNDSFSSDAKMEAQTYLKDLRYKVLLAQFNVEKISQLTDTVNVKQFMKPEVFPEYTYEQTKRHLSVLTKTLILKEYQLADFGSIKDTNTAKILLTYNSFDSLSIDTITQYLVNQRITTLISSGKIISAWKIRKKFKNSVTFDKFEEMTDSYLKKTSNMKAKAAVLYNIAKNDSATYELCSMLLPYTVNLAAIQEFPLKHYSKTQTEYYMFDLKSGKPFLVNLYKQNKKSVIEVNGKVLHRADSIYSFTISSHTNGGIHFWCVDNGEISYFVNSNKLYSTNENAVTDLWNSSFIGNPGADYGSIILRNFKKRLNQVYRIYNNKVYGPYAASAVYKNYLIVVNGDGQEFAQMPTMVNASGGIIYKNGVPILKLAFMGKLQNYPPHGLDITCSEDQKNYMYIIPEQSQSWTSQNSSKQWTLQSSSGFNRTFNGIYVPQNFGQMTTPDEPRVVISYNAISNKGNVAYCIQEEDNFTWWINNEEIKNLSGIEPCMRPIFSKENELSFLSRKDNKLIVVKNNTLSEYPYPTQNFPPVWGKGNSSYAIAVSREKAKGATYSQGSLRRNHSGTWAVFSNGQLISEWFDKIYEIHSVESAGFAYIALKNKKYYVFINSKMIHVSDGAWNLNFKNGYLSWFFKKDTKRFVARIRL